MLGGSPHPRFSDEAIAKQKKEANLVTPLC